MAYSELIKSIDKVRDYMRQFYVYGFKSRTEYDKKSARSYDNERRRIESWLGEYMRFRQTTEGKNVFLSVDSRSISHNPLYQAFKAKSFTDGDVTFHFYILDLLQDGEGHTAQEILDCFLDCYLCHFETDWQPDLSTVRKKLKEYVALGLLKSEKRGREVVFSRNDSGVSLHGWEQAISFFSEVDPLGVIGSFLLDQLGEIPDHFQFKHHYMLHALDSEILLQLLSAIGENRRVMLTNASVRKDQSTKHLVYPVKIFISTQTGRQYLLCHHYAFRKMIFFRLDYILTVEPKEMEAEPERFSEIWEKFQPHLWGTSGGQGFQVDHLEMTVRYGASEGHIPKRLEREKRNGTVEIIDEHTCRYSVDVYDASELIPWLRTFIGRIVELKCSDQAVVDRFYGDLEKMAAMYGGEG
ncbi:MAG: WYL domain-containing protein [Ruminococcaceae bacterium]|nr:WYL domain-containing protein [Oscillospiraceae bacterium]